MIHFKKTGKNKPLNNSPGEGWLTPFLSSAHHKIAGFLNRKTATWSPQKVKLVLILFCLVSGNICLYIIGRAILSDNGPPPVILKIKRLDIPAAMSRKRSNLPPKDTTYHH